MDETQHGCLRHASLLSDELLHGIDLLEDHDHGLELLLSMGHDGGVVYAVQMG